MHPAKPADLSTPGLNWRPRKGGWIAYWIARADIVERGYPLKSVRVWPPSTGAGGEPTADEWRGIASLCEKLQAEMLAWGKVDAYVRRAGDLRRHSCVPSQDLPR